MLNSDRPVRLSKGTVVHHKFTNIAMFCSLTEHGRLVYANNNITIDLEWLYKLATEHMDLRYFPVGAQEF